MRGPVLLIIGAIIVAGAVAGVVWFLGDGDGDFEEGGGERRNAV